MSRDVRKAMIEPDHPELSLSRQCRLVAISRSQLYYRPQPANEKTLALMRRIDEIYLACPCLRQPADHAPTPSGRTPGRPASGSPGASG